MAKDKVSKKFEDTENGRKYPTPMKAVKAFCKCCIGGGVTKVMACDAKECDLYAYRLGKNPFRAKRVLSDEFREAASARFKAMHAAKKTPAKKVVKKVDAPAPAKKRVIKKIAAKK